MRSLSFTLNDNAGANNPFNLYKILSGTQVTGVTIAGSAKTFPSIPVNTAWVKIQSDTTNVGVIVWVGDGFVNKTGNGYPIGSGGEFMQTGEGDNKAISLASLFIAVNGAAVKVHVTFDG